MDDCVLIHAGKKYLVQCMAVMQQYIEEELYLEFNQKTQIQAVRNGVDYHGFHFYLTENGKVIRKIRQQKKYKYKRKLKAMQRQYSNGELTFPGPAPNRRRSASDETTCSPDMSRGRKLYTNNKTLKIYIMWRKINWRILCYN